VFSSCLLAACGGIEHVVPERSTLAEVREKMGRPTDIRFDADGNETWEYASGPMGEQTYLVRARKDGRVIEIGQLLTETQFAKIVPNVTTKAQARELLGRPSEQNFFGGQTVWSWRMRISPQSGYYVVKFDRDGVVTEAGVMFDAIREDRDSRERGGGRGGGGRDGRD